MALMTPRGLKIRLSLDWAFTLIARLWLKDSRTDAFRVLRTVEAIELVPTVLGFVGSVAAALVPSWPIWFVALGAILGRLIGILLTQGGMFLILRPLGIMLLARGWCFLPGNGVEHVVAVVMLFYVRGWWLLPAWLVGHLGGMLLLYFADILVITKYKRLVGQPFTPSEVNFFSAYRLHADRLGVSRDIDVSDTEMANGKWYFCLMDYAKKWPKAVRRFPLTIGDQALLSRAEAEVLRDP